MSIRNNQRLPDARGAPLQQLLAPGRTPELGHRPVEPDLHLAFESKHTSSFHNQTMQKK